MRILYRRSTNRVCYTIYNMRNNDQGIYIVIVIFALLVLAGFYLMFDKVGSVQTDVKNLSLEIELLKNKADITVGSNTPATQTPPSATNTTIPPTSSNSSQNIVPQNGITIPTAIIASTQSSPTLQPQTTVTVTLESVTKQSDGTVTLVVKTFTNDATGYSAFDPQTFFQLIDLNGDTQKATQVTGQFNSIPPKSAIEGTLTFKIDPTQSTLILQVGSGDNPTFYEFNFDKKSYKETIIG